MKKISQYGAFAVLTVIISVIIVLMLSPMTSDAAVTVNVDSYAKLKNALDNSSAGTRVIVVSNITVPSGSVLSVPNGVKLILAYDNNGNYGGNDGKDYLCSNDACSKYYASSSACNNPKYTLTIESGATLNVYGTFYVGGLLTSCPNYFINAGDEVARGNTSKIYSKVVVDGEISLNGGSLYTYGYIEGSGKINVKNSGNLYTPFVVCGFKAGSYFYGMGYVANQCPVTEYSIPNIKCDADINYGSNLYGLFALYSGDSVNVCISKLVGTSDVLIVLESSDSVASVSYTDAPDSSIRFGKTKFTVNGTIRLEGLKIEVLYKTMDTRNFVFPLSHGIELNVESGTLYMCRPFSLLPGAKIRICKDANAVIEKGGQLLVSGGFYDTADYFGHYPYSDVLEKNSCSSVGELEIFGRLTVQDGGTLAGTVSKVDGGVIDINDKAILSGQIQMGMASRFNVNFTDYEYYNKTVYPLKAKALGIDGKLFDLQAGKTYYSAQANEEAQVDSFEYIYYGLQKNSTPQRMTGQSSLSVKGSVHSEGIVYTFADGSVKTSDTSALLPLSPGNYWYDARNGMIVEDIQNKEAFYMLCECSDTIEIVSDDSICRYAIVDHKVYYIPNEKQHYDLVGYSLSENGNADYSLQDSLPQSITRLYAVWAPKDYEIRYYLDELNYGKYKGGYIEKNEKGYLIDIKTQKYGQTPDRFHLSEQMAVSGLYFEWQSPAVLECDTDIYGVYFEYGVRNTATGVIHPTLSNAIEKAGNNDVLRLQFDFNESVTVPEGITLTIDLNGRTLSYDSGSVITNNGNLTLIDSKGGGKIIQKGKSAASSLIYYALSNSVGASLTIDGAKLENSVDSVNTQTLSNKGSVIFLSGSIVSSGGYSVYNYGTKAEFIQLGGSVEFKGTSTSSYGVYNYNNAKYILDGGSVTAFGNSKAFCNHLRSSLTLKSGEILSENSGSIYNNGGYVYIYGGRVITNAISSQTYAIQSTKVSNISPELNVYGGEIISSSGSRAVYNSSGIMNVYGGYIASEGQSVSAWGIYNYQLSTLNIYGGEICSIKSHAIYNYSTSASSIPILNVYGGLIRSDAGSNYYPVMNADSSKYGMVNIYGGAFMGSGNYSVYSASASYKTVLDSSALGGEYKYIKSAFYNYQDNTGGMQMSPTENGSFILIPASDEKTVRESGTGGKEYYCLSQAISCGVEDIILLKDVSINYPIKGLTLTIDLAGHTLSLGANTLNSEKLIIKDSVGGGVIEGMELDGFSSTLFEGDVILGELYRENDIFLGYSADGSNNFYDSLPRQGRIVLYPAFASETLFSVVFKDYDGRILSQGRYHYGDHIDIPETPERTSDKVFVYTFKGWTNEVDSICRADAEYTAEYDEDYIEYSVKFENSDGTLLSELYYHYGDELFIVPDIEKGTIGLTERFDFSHWVDHKGVEYSIGYTVREDTKFIAVYKTAELNDSFDNEYVKFNSATVVFESAMSINFRVIYDDFKDFEKVYACFVKTLPDNTEQTVIVSDYTVNGEYMVFSYCGIVAKEIGDDIRATIYAIEGDTRYCSASVDYGIRTYAERMLNRSSTETAYKRALISMLDYGAAAQVYFGYKTDDLANSSITQSMRPYGMFDGGDIKLTSVTNYERNGSEKARFVSATLMFINNVTINYQLDLSKYTADKEKLSVVLKYVDCNGSSQICVRDFSDMKANGNLYSADFDCIAVKDMGREVRTEIYENYYDPDNRVSVGGTLIYGIESYAASKQNSTTPGLSDLVKYMMAFSRETEAYFVG